VEEGFDGHRRMNDSRLTPVGLPDATLHVFAVGHEFIHARRSAEIP